MMAPIRPDRAAANALATAWRQSERAYHDRRREQNRVAWRDYHLTLAASVLEVARALSAKHLAAAAALAKENGGRDHAG
jgi:hypothetical protein